jgi:hypothetical protein
MQLATLRAKYGALVPVFTERSRRVWAATEAQAIGYGGIARGWPSRRSGAGCAICTCVSPCRRRAGGGRKRATVTDPTLLRDALVEPTAPAAFDHAWRNRSARRTPFV